MLFIALFTSHLTSGLRIQAVIAKNRENRILSLYEMASELTGIVTPDQIVGPCVRFIAANFGTQSVLLFPDKEGKLIPVEGHSEKADLLLAQQVFDEKTDTWDTIISRPHEDSMIIPLKGSVQNQGILVLSRCQTDDHLSDDQKSLLRTCITFVGLVLERLTYAAREREALLEIESERLRNALLASLSHDIRTPVAAMAGMADAMQLCAPPLSEIHQTMLEGMRNQTRLILSDVDKLLDMARLHRDMVTLHKEWQVLEEVVGSALKTSKVALNGYDVCVRMDDEIPLLEIDAMMMERVFCNLLENATRHTPTGSRIEISAHVANACVTVRVADNGPGFPQGQEESIFSKFIHGRTVTGTGGVGLGLSIVRAIIKAHGGGVRAENLEEGGASFTITLPIGEPPFVTLETGDMSS